MAHEATPNKEITKYAKSFLWKESLIREAIHTKRESMIPIFVIATSSASSIIKVERVKVRIQLTAIE